MVGVVDAEPVIDEDEPIEVEVVGTEDVVVVGRLLVVVDDPTAGAVLVDDGGAADTGSAPTLESATLTICHVRKVVTATATSQERPSFQRMLFIVVSISTEVTQTVLKVSSRRAFHQICDLTSVHGTDRPDRR